MNKNLTKSNTIKINDDNVIFYRNKAVAKVETDGILTQVDKQNLIALFDNFYNYHIYFDNTFYKITDDHLDFIRTVTKYGCDVRNFIYCIETNKPSKKDFITMIERNNCLVDSMNIETFNAWVKTRDHFHEEKIADAIACLSTDRHYEYSINIISDFEYFDYNYSSFSKDEIIKIIKIMQDFLSSYSLKNDIDDSYSQESHNMTLKYFIDYITGKENIILSENYQHYRDFFIDKFFQLGIEVHSTIFNDDIDLFSIKTDFKSHFNVSCEQLAIILEIESNKYCRDKVYQAFKEWYSLLMNGQWNRDWARTIKYSDYREIVLSIENLINDDDKKIVNTDYWTLCAMNGIFQ